MKHKVLFWSIVTALGGFLFGFDTAVISGAEKAIQQLWQLSAVAHGFTISIALIGTVLGAVFGGLPSDALGRRQTLRWIAVLYLVSAVGAALAPGWGLFLVFRFLGGLGVGASSVTAPLYISEISPAESRGRLVGLFQFNIVFGILAAYLSNYLLANVGDHSWRLMLGVQAVPALAFLLFLFRVPESPRWLLLHGRVAEGRDVLEIINPTNVDATVAAIQASQARDAGQSESLWSPQYRTPVLLAMAFAFFNQVSGINAIIYYAPRIFEMTGRGQSAALLSSAGIGLVNFVFTLLGVNLIDRFGRRTLMWVGSVGLIGYAGAGGAGLLHAGIQRGAGLTVRLHCLFRLLAGRGYLGLHLRDFSQRRAGQRPGAGQLHALGYGHGHRLHLPLVCRAPGRRQHVRLFRRHDGPAAGFRAPLHARNQRHESGRGRKNADYALGPPRHTARH